MDHKTEMAAAILQARMSWPDAERCAAALEQAGWTSLSRSQAVAVLQAVAVQGQRMSEERAAACAQDLRFADLIKEG